MQHLKLTAVFLMALLIGCAHSTAGELPPVATPANHVLIVVMDGLRRDTVTPEQMPTLYALSQQGVFFNAHHPVYPSSTQVNGTALATGMKPASSNVIANREYRPNLELLHPIDMNDEYYAWYSDNQNKAPSAPPPPPPKIPHKPAPPPVAPAPKPVPMLWARSYRTRTPSHPPLFEGMPTPAATLDPIIAN